ncbi:SDR family NAD(P)-dependent oxidoreductase [Microbacterium sp. JZ37]|uniref:SDR family NAD(P)-dependent oxidoreductase n=1 Tax=Microbacterium sp. JZ37 TaxID=2654193 RepID=UPI002B46DD08|nr:SDR family NAD(P)-dependent oxidoreductase [Microbacterium sp. JZ37]
MSREAVFLTGANGGIGRATVARLSGTGLRVFAGVRDRATAAVFDGLDGVESVHVDVADDASVATAAREVERRLGGDRLAAVVNNAGIIVQGPLEQVPPAELERQFRVNVLGPASVIRAFGELIRRDGARVVNVSAPTARRAVPHLGAISASKAALEALSAALRVELAPWGCDVVIVEPTAAETGVFAAAAESARAVQGEVPSSVRDAYREQCAAVERATEKQSLADPDSVAAVLVRAITARRPRTVYFAGRGARVLPMLSALPDRMGDRLVAGSFGLDARVRRQS